MRQVLTRRWYVVLFTVLAAPVAAASVAAACTALATFEVNPPSATAGDEISGTGKGFRASHGGPADELASPVQIRFDSRSGPVLWSGNPDASGNIGFSLTVPDAAAGDYTLIATQNGADGKPVYGTPARQSLTITSATASQSFAEQSVPVAPASDDPVAPVAAPAPAPVVAPAPASPATAVVPDAAPAAAPAAAVPAAPSTASALDATAAPQAPVAPSPATEPAPVSAVAPAAALPQTAPATPSVDTARAAPVDVEAITPASSSTSTAPSVASSLLDAQVLLLLGVGLALISLGFMWRQPKVADLR